MLESGSSGSVRGVPSNGHPYRDPRSRLSKSALSLCLLNVLPTHNRSYLDAQPLAVTSPGRSNAGWLLVVKIRSLVPGLIPLGRP
jgi:hypothetical protein